MGAFQLPDSVLGDAIGCLIYSFLCLIANSLLVWLIWTHNERKTCTSTSRFQKTNNKPGLFYPVHSPSIN